MSHNGFSTTIRFLRSVGMNFVWVVVEDDFWGFFIKLVVVVVPEMDKGVAAI